MVPDKKLEMFKSLPPTNDVRRTTTEKTDSKICHLSDSGDLKKRIVQVVLFKKLDEAYILRYNVNVTIHIIGIKSRASIAMREKRCLKNIKGCTKFLVNPL